MDVGPKADLNPDQLKACEPHLKCLLSRTEEGWDLTSNKTVNALTVFNLHGDFCRPDSHPCLRQLKLDNDFKATD
jgi:hypothetical protein